MLVVVGRPLVRGFQAILYLGPERWKQAECIGLEMKERQSSEHHTGKKGLEEFLGS